MLSLVAAFLAASQPVPPPDRLALGRTAWVVGTVNHSEWCPAGNVRLDLSTGRYQFTAGARRPACTDPRIERPVRAGTLDPRRLATIRSAVLRVLTEDVASPACREGRRPDEVVISNGGTRALVVTSGARTLSAPDNRACWSRAASALHDTLETAFPAPRRR